MGFSKEKINIQENNVLKHVKIESLAPDTRVKFHTWDDLAAEYGTRVSISIAGRLILKTRYKVGWDNMNKVAGKTCVIDRGDCNDDSVHIDGHPYWVPIESVKETIVSLKDLK